MKITESKLKKVIAEEVERIISEEQFPAQEEVLRALEILSEASTEALKENAEIIQNIMGRIKSS